MSEENGWGAPPPLAPDIADQAWFSANAFGMLTSINADGALQSLNPAWTTATGWSVEALIGRRFLDLVHPEDRARVAADMAAVGRTRLRLSAADERWLWLEGRLQRRPDGRTLAVFRDITEDRRRADELEHLREVQQRLGQSAGVGLWKYDPETGVVEWSAEWLAMLAEAGIEIRTADDFLAICHPDDAASVVAAIRGVATNREVALFDHRFRGADGVWIWIRAHIWPEALPDGRIVVHGISQDITELAAARSAAEAHTQRLRIALGAARGAVIEIDYVARRVWTSPEFEALIGRRLDFAQAASAAWPFLHPDDLPQVEALVHGWRRGRPIEPFDARYVAPNGAVRWGRLFLEIQKGEDGRWLRAVGLLMDIDQLKRQELALIQAEKAAQLAAEAKSQFLANMSHEIRTPMNGVLGVLHLLKSQRLAGEARAMVDEALSCGRMLQALLDDVVDFSKIEAGRLELLPEAADPAAIVRGVVKMLRPQAEDKGLTMHSRADELPARVLVDPVRLRQCLFNLIGNAVKFTINGGITVRARQLGSGAACRLRFEVQDTGIGIAPDAQAMLFRRFQQADASTTRRFGGSGLGLAITRLLVELMDGEVGMRSTPGEGSTFWFEIAAPEAEAACAPAADADLLLEGLRVLVVEDNCTNRMIATKMLEGLGASVETAEDGEAGVAAAERGFDLILMDIQMPGIDGLEAARRIRAAGGPSAATPIVALTANVLTHQRASYLEAGMDGWVAKPISPAALLGEIARIAATADDAAAVTG
jgi:PAS domain S-box-containing protein